MSENSTEVKENYSDHKSNPNLQSFNYWLVSYPSAVIRFITYINTNEIPGELPRENLISSHVKISPLLWLHNKLHLSDQKTISGRLEIRNFSSRVKKIFHLFAALTRDIFFNTRREISYLRVAM